MHWFLKLLILTFSLATFYLFIGFSLAKLLPTQVIKNTSISGLVFQNQIWEGNITVVGDLWFTPGSTVSVRPGTEIVVAIKDDKNNFDFLPWHLKSGINIGENYQGTRRGEPFWDEGEKIQIHFGKLFILGTKQEPVLLRSQSSLGSPYDFNSISINSGIISHLKASNYRRLEIGDNTTIRDSIFSNIGECAICISSGKPTIINNLFNESLREYIWVYGASPRITDNTFMKSTGEGIRINPARIGTAVISYNNFEMPGSKAIDIQAGDELEGGVISSNIFSGNSVIKLVCDTKTQIIQNSILGLVEFTSPGCANSYTFGPNYWGTNNAETVLKEKIINKEANFKLNIPFVLTSPSSNLGKRI